MTASNLGVIANVRGDEEEARQYYEASLADSRGAGLADRPLRRSVNLGLLNMQPAHLDAADRHLDGGPRAGTVIGDRNMLVTVELHLASLASSRATMRARASRAPARAGSSRRSAIQASPATRSTCYGIVARASGDAAAAEAALPPRRADRAASVRTCSSRARSRASWPTSTARQGRNRADAPAPQPGAPALRAAARAARARRRRPPHGAARERLPRGRAASGASRSSRRTSTRRATACASPTSPARSGRA